MKTVFYSEKFKSLRKEHRWTLSALSKKCEISRVSLSKWENGKAVPSEKKIHALARFFNVSTSLLSNITDYREKEIRASSSISEITENMLNPDIFMNEIAFLQQRIGSLEKYLTETSLVINALMTSIHAIFYVKDINLRYVICNKSFINIANKKSFENVYAKNDNLLFPEKEAKANEKEDLSVINYGKQIIDKEDYIIGTRKKRWGLISKMPIFDKHKNILGVATVIVDITEKKLLEKMRSALDNAVNKIEECVWVARIVNLEKNTYKVIYLNDAIEKMSGAKKEEFFKDPELWTKFIHPSCKEEILKNRLSQEFPRRYEYVAFKKDSNEEYIREDVTYRDGDMFFGIAKDVTAARENIINNNKLKIAMKLKEAGIEKRIIEEATGINLQKMLDN